MNRIWKYRIEYKGREMLVFSRLLWEEFERTHLGAVVISYVCEGRF